VYPIIFIDPNMSPGGSKVVMATHQVPEYPHSHVWTVRADGGGLTALGVGAHPVWSPDGTRIAFAAGSDICLESLGHPRDERRRDGPGQRDER